MNRRAVARRSTRSFSFSTAFTAAHSASEPRPYRFGYGYLDENQNYKVDPGEKKLYFEISDYSTNYVFYENPRD